MELNETIDPKIISFFVENGWLTEGEEVLEYTKAGNGNMNFVMRLKTKDRSIIIKQSRAYVNAHPSIVAPINRIYVEKAYFDLMAENELLKAKGPSVLGFSKEHYLLVLSDLGKCNDFSNLYTEKNIKQEELIELVDYLIELHRIKNVKFPDNIKMRNLNHEHIFEFPFDSDNDYDYEAVQAGLTRVALGFQKDHELKDAIKKLGKTYMNYGETIIHGDFYPGSWLLSNNNIMVIDPEFAFLGFGEFDLGVMIAHLKMAKVNPEFIPFVLERYKAKNELNEDLLWSVVGVEILRRLFGVAQLPLDLTLKEKEILAEEASSYLKK